MSIVSSIPGRDDSLRARHVLSLLLFPLLDALSDHAHNSERFLVCMKRAVSDRRSGDGKGKSDR